MRPHARKKARSASLLRLVVASAALLGLVAGCGAGADADAGGRGALVGDAAPEAAGDPGAATSSAPDADATSPAPSGRAGPQAIDITEMGYTEGDHDAPIRVIEFSDFGCHFCRKFHLETYPALHDQYVATGKVLWKYIPYVLGIFPHSVEAARAGECAISEDESRFPALRDRFFQDQKEWKEADDPTEIFTRLAEESGLDADEFRTCLEEKRPEERVRRNIAVGRQIGVRGTPTFVVGGFPLSGAQPLEVFQQIFDQMLSDPEVDGEATGGGTQ